MSYATTTYKFVVVSGYNAEQTCWSTPPIAGREDLQAKMSMSKNDIMAWAGSMHAPAAASTPEEMARQFNAQRPMRSRADQRDASDLQVEIDQPTHLKAALSAA